MDKELYPRMCTILMRPKDSLDCSWFWVNVEGVGRTTGGRYYFYATGNGSLRKLYVADEVLWEYPED